MNIFQLECFLSVANTLSFARSAEQLNVSQPTITHQIKTLENELNVKLFCRSTRFVEITPEGQDFIGDAKSMVIISRRAKRRFSTEEKDPVALLSIGCSSHAEFIMLTEVLNEINRVTKHFHPRLIVAPQDRLFHLLETEQVDIMFDAYESEDLKASVKYKELCKSAITCVCRHDHHLLGKESVKLWDLQEESLVFCDPVSIAEELTKFQFKVAEMHSPKDIHFCSSVDSAIVLATAGIGIAFLPEIYILDTPKLSKITLEDAPQISFGMFYKSYPGDSMLKRFIQMAVEYFQKSIIEEEQTYGIQPRIGHGK